MHNFNFFGGGWMMFIWGFLIIALIVFAVRFLVKTNQNSSKKKQTPMDILKRRYASGEIDEKEFQKRKKKLLK